MFKVNNAQTMMVVEYDDKPCALVEVELQAMRMNTSRVSPSYASMCRN